MKKLFILVTLAVVAASCSSDKGYIITGELSDLSEGTVYLKVRKAGEWINVDSSDVTEGKFMMEGSVEVPEMYYFMVDGKRGSAAFFLENSAISITGYADTLYKAEISGSSIQDEYKAFREGSEAFRDDFRKFYTGIKDAKSAGDVELEKQLQAQYDSVGELYDTYQLDFVKNNPGSFVAPTVLRGLTYEMEGAEIAEYLDGFSKEVKETSLVKDLYERVEVLKKVAIGMPAPDFTMNDTSGAPVTLSSHFGKVLLVDFWAAWCGPCRAENPNVVAAYRKYKDRGFDVFGVSLDRTKEDWIKAIHDDTLTWTHVSDLKYWSNEAAKLYGVNAIPGNFLLDAEGKILARNVRGEELHEKLAELLGE